MEHVDGVVVTYSGVEHVVDVERLDELVVVRELCFRTMTVLFRSVILVYITPCDGEEDFGA